MPSLRGRWISLKKLSKRLATSQPCCCCSLRCQIEVDWKDSASWLRPVDKTTSLGDAPSCIELLLNTGRLPEAALFARSYHPAFIPGIVKSWRRELETVGNSKLAQTIGDPEEDSELFTEGWMGSGVPDGEGSGVMVEKEDEEDAKGVVKTVTEPIEDLAEKVKEMVVGNGNGDVSQETKRFDVEPQQTVEQDEATPASTEAASAPAGKKKGGKKK